MKLVFILMILSVIISTVFADDTIKDSLDYDPLSKYNSQFQISV